MATIHVGHRARCRDTGDGGRTAVLVEVTLIGGPGAWDLQSSPILPRWLKENRQSLVMARRRGGVGARGGGSINQELCSPQHFQLVQASFTFCPRYFNRLLTTSLSLPTQSPDSRQQDPGEKSSQGLITPLLKTF